MTSLDGYKLLPTRQVHQSTYRSKAGPGPDITMIHQNRGITNTGNQVCPDQESSRGKKCLFSITKSILSHLKQNSNEYMKKNYTKTIHDPNYTKSICQEIRDSRKGKHCAYSFH